MENMDLSTFDIAESIVLIQTFKKEGTMLSLQTTLYDFQPNFIIMYHNNMTAIRQIEVYEARRRKQPRLKLYFLIYARTVEEQSYLTTLRREKQAFEHLIETKSTMTVPENQDGKNRDCEELERDEASCAKNTRRGGYEADSQEKRSVVVDMREFRSDLPALIHKRGIDIEPVTITV